MDPSLGEQIFRIIRAHFEEHERPGFAMPPIGGETTFEQLGADPLDGLEILMDVEDQCGADLSYKDDAITPAMTLGEFVDQVMLALMGERIT